MSTPGGVGPPGSQSALSGNGDLNKDKKINNKNDETDTFQFSNLEHPQKIEQVFYTDTDLGPFIVYLESTEKTGFNIGKFNTVKIAREIFNLNLTDIKKINKKGTNRLSIEFTTFQNANNCVNNTTLLNKGYKMFIPFNFVTSKGLIRQVDSDVSDDELLKHGQASGNIEILSATRLKRKVINNETKNVSYQPTGSV